MKNPSIPKSLLVAALFLLSFSRAFAQTSAVSGHVADSQGLPIQSAAVKIVSAATGETQTATTNHEGYYLFPPMNPGSYIIRAGAPGFGDVTVEHVLLEVGTPRQVDVKMEPRTLAQSTVVTATPPQLVLDTPSRGNVIEAQFVQNTPLNVRNPLQLVNFAQGVTSYSAYGSSSGNNDVTQALTNTFRINGGKMATTENLLDGAANTTEYDYNAAASIPQVDAIQEFKVLTTAYDPQWGRTSGGIVTFATKSGTNDLHGTLYEYIRNSDLDARGFNANVAGIHQPHFERNQFGYALGGPVVLPRLYNGHDRTFFFSSFEDLRQSQATSFTGTVPTVLERQGNFSQTRDSNGNLIVIYNPHTTMTDPTAPPGVTRYIRSPYAGNIIPASDLNAVGKTILNDYPLPNQPGQGQSSVNNFFSNTPATSTQAIVDERVDHRFNDQHAIFARFDWFQRHNNAADSYGNGLTPGLNRQRLPGYNGMINHTWVLSPTMVFEHHFVYAHQESNRTPAGYGFDPTSLGFAPNVGANLRALTFPSITSVSRISGLGPSSGLEHDGGTVAGYAASLSQLRGTHDFKYGFDFRHFSTQLSIAPLVTVTASSNYTGGPNAQAAVGDSGSGVADLLLGASTVSTGVAPAYNLSHPYFAFYAQDHWSVTPKFTLTYGLRYNIELSDVESNNQQVYLDLSSPSPLNAQVTSLGPLRGGVGFVGVNGMGPRIQTAELSNFDPRLGLAYRLNEKTVLRAGAGLFHAPALDSLSFSSPGFSNVTSSLAAQPNGVTPLFNLSNPFPQGIIQPTGSTLGLATMLGQNISGYARHDSVSYTEQWSADVQRELPGNLVITVGYAANRALRLYVPINYNQLPDSALALGTNLLAPARNPFNGVITDPTSPLHLPTVQAGQLLRPYPQFLNMTATASLGQSSYQSLQISLERRFSSGLALLFAYTHSKTIDNVGDYFSFNQPQDNNCLRCERSISNQDLANVIRLSGQYELPFGRGKPFANGGWISRVAGGFALGAFFTFDDGLPVAVTSPNFSNSFGGGTVMRPDATGLSAGVPGGSQIFTGGLYFNPAAFTPTPSYQFGNASRYISTIRAPGTFNWDMLLSRSIRLTERFSLDARGEFFNAFNNVQFGPPNTSISSTSFGRIYLTQVNNPREIQGSLRFRF